MNGRVLRAVAKWTALAGVAGPAFLMQQACAIDPDIFLRAFLQVASETAIFALDNLVVGLR
jgi:hypothetical protein